MICPVCEEAAIRDPDYRPEKGLDPLLRRYICTNPQCQNVWYYLGKRVKQEPPAEQTKLD